MGIIGGSRRDLIILCGPHSTGGVLWGFTCETRLVALLDARFFNVLHPRGSLFSACGIRGDPVYLNLIPCLVPVKDFNLGADPFVGLLHSTLSKLLELASLPRRSASQRDEAVSFMKELRGHGFTNRDVEVLVGGRWKEATIKRYTRGVKVGSTEERDLVLETYSSFVAAGKTLQDVEGYLVVNNLLESQQVSLETIVHFIAGMTSQRVNLSKFTDLYLEIEDQEYTVTEIVKDMDALRNLEQNGISRETMRGLNEETIKFGGLESFLKVISAYKDLQGLLKAKNEAVQLFNEQRLELEKIESEIQVTHAKSLRIQTYYNVAESLVYEHSFDLHSLNDLIGVARKYGSPTVIFEALNAYENLQKFKTELEAIRIGIERLEKERNTKEAEILSLNRFIERANRAIGEVEAGRKNILTVQVISELVDGIGDIEIDPLRFKQISLLFLLRINQFAKQHSSVLVDWEKKVSFFLKYTINALTEIQ